MSGAIVPNLLPTVDLAVNPVVDRLPTMYDLPSEDPLEPGLPDEFHGLQPQLLADTFHPPAHSVTDIFCACDLNLYYDPKNTQWYKRPDWFVVLGVPYLYKGQSTRSSYVTWDEKVNPVLVIEFLSPGTEAEDLGRFAKKTPAPPQPGRPPNKFTVYEQILQIPNYLVFNEPDRQLRYFRLVEGRYVEQPIALQNPLVWIPELELGLGLWEGTVRRIRQLWLRWCDGEGNWLLTETDQALQAKEQERRAKLQAELSARQALQAQEQERQDKEEALQAKEEALQAKEEALQAKERLEAYLRSQGIDPNNLP